MTLRLHVGPAATRNGHARIWLSRAYVEVGYESEAAFNRAFKREFGMAPGVCRKETLEP